MKRIFLLAVICLAGVQSLVAQRFTHGAGIGLFAEAGKDKTKSKSGFTLTYSPRLSFAETNRTSLSIGIPLIVGISGEYEGFYEGEGNLEKSSLAYTIEVPLMFNLNIGAGSARGCKDKMGYFIGAGYAYHAGSVYETPIGGPGYRYRGFKSATGVTANMGVRIAVGANRKRNIEIRTLYTQGLTSYKPRLLELSCLFNF